MCLVGWMLLALYFSLVAAGCSLALWLSGGKRMCVRWELLL